MPKATCTRCGRPIAVLKAGRCLYCGTATPGAQEVARAAIALPPEVLFALEPRASGVSNRSKWIRRVIALVISSLLMTLFVGQCMRS